MDAPGRSFPQNFVVFWPKAWPVGYGGVGMPKNFFFQDPSKLGKAQLMGPQHGRNDSSDGGEGENRSGIQWEDSEERLLDPIMGEPTISDTLLLSPWEKFVKYNKFPFKVCSSYFVGVHLIGDLFRSGLF